MNTQASVRTTCGPVKPTLSGSQTSAAPGVRSQVSDIIAAREFAAATASSRQPDLDEVLRVMPVGVVILDVEGRVAFGNARAEELLGDPLVGQQWRSIIKRAFRPRLDDGHDMSLSDGRRVSVNTHALEGWPGQLLVLTDVTATRRLQEECGRRERLSTLGRMSAYLAHQIRTPLAAALTYTSHLSTQTVPGAEHDRFMASLKARLFDIEGLIRELMIFATGGALTRARVNVADVICDARETLESLLAESGSSMALHLDPRCGPILGNREALSTALQNLVNNAIQSKGGPTRLEISTHRTDAARLEIHVSDDGPGIAEAEREAIFQPFYTTRTVGSGLGLALVRTVLEAHDGQIWVESGRDGGSMFKVCLPMMPAEDAAACTECWT